MKYMTTQINESATIVDVAGATIADVRCKAVKLTDAGIVLAGAGEAAVGIGIITNDENIVIGDDVHIQVKDIGLVYAGAEITKGAELAVGADGVLVPAKAGDYVVAIALEKAEAVGRYIKARLVNYKI